MPNFLQGGHAIFARVLLIAWLLILTLTSSIVVDRPIRSAAAQSLDAESMLTSRIIVHGAALSWSDAVELIAATGATSVASVPRLPEAYLAQYASPAEASHAEQRLNQESAISSIESDAMAHYAFEPTDPMFKDQFWAQSIDLPAAWNITAGSESIVVAVVDSGVQASHPDLVGQVLPGTDLYYRDDIPEDDIGHGTAVAGIIAARGDNGVGIAGVAMNVKILPVKVGGKDGAPISVLSSGIIWAVDQGADIINLSLVADLPSPTLHEALQYAYDRNVPVITAAGNDPYAITYPGNYEEAITVGASTTWGTLASFSSTTNRVDLVAPGSSVLAPWWSEVNGNGWTTVTGTSFATPMVTGTAALLLSINPNLEIEEIRELLKSSAAQIGDAFPEAGSGAGQLDAGTAVRQLLSKSFDVTWLPADDPVASGLADRSWVWGPGSILTGFENYVDAREGERLVRYYDKARMEINDPLGDLNDPWYVTNGLLVSEMISGKMQIGDNLFEYRGPADVAVAGDPSDPEAPTYSDFRKLLDAPSGNTGELVTQMVDANGVVSAVDSYGVYGITNGAYIAETDHQIASVFWNFLNGYGFILVDGSVEYGPIFDPVFFATGLPITEPYWMRVHVDGELTDVLVQCFERRCLTYNPSNPIEWRVELGNVGQHYYNWRYQDEFVTNPDARFQDVIDRASRNGDLLHHRVRELYSRIH